jgi:putative ABC transport system permease protein
MWYTNIYMLNDSKEMDDFKAAVTEIVPEFFAAQTTSDTYGNIASSMDSLRNLASIILWVAVGAAILILSLLITLFLRERRREIGILLALGESKGKVIAQMMIEVLVVALLAIGLALLAGNLISGSISQSLLQNDLVAGSSTDQGMSFGTLEMLGYGSSITANDVLDNYRVSLDPIAILLFTAISISTVIVATIIPMIYIVRLNPKRILM